MAGGVPNPAFWLRRSLAALFPVGIPFLLGIPLTRATPLEASLLGVLGIMAAANLELPAALVFLAGGWTYGVGLAGYGAERSQVPLPLEGVLTRALGLEEKQRRRVRPILTLILSLPWLFGVSLFWTGLLEKEVYWALLGEVLAIGGFLLVAPQVEVLAGRREGKR